MKVKIGNTIYSPNDEPIMLILSAQDKVNILGMLPTATKYCVFDEDKYTTETIGKWMETNNDNNS